MKIDTGALIHGGFGVAGVLASMGLGIYGFALIAPLLFYGREMRDSQRERGSEGIGHRNEFMLVDLLPGLKPRRWGTIQDWVFPLIPTLLYFALR